MRNPIRNAIQSITRRDLVTCKRCGCPDLAWVKFKSGKSGLVKTAGERPFWRGEGPAPEGLFALKFNFHRCDEYRTAIAQAEETRRIIESAPHPNAANPGKILGNALAHLLVAHGPAAFSNLDHPVCQAAGILAEAASQVAAPEGETR